MEREKQRMKTWKKFWVLVLCVFVMTGMAACGNNANDGSGMTGDGVQDATNAPEQGTTNNGSDDNNNGVLDDTVNDVTNGVDNAVDDVTDGVDNVVDDITHNNGTTDNNGTNNQNNTNTNNNNTNNTNTNR